MNPTNGKTKETMKKMICGYDVIYENLTESMMCRGSDNEECRHAGYCFIPDHP